MPQQNILPAAIRSLLYYLTPAERTRAALMFSLQIVASFLDVFGLASLVPVVMLAAEPGAIHRSRWASWLYNNLGFEQDKAFLVSAILLVFAFFLVKNIFTSWVNYQQVRFTARVALKIIDQQFSKYTTLPFWKFQELGTAQLANDALVVPNTYLNGIIRQIFILLGEIIVVFIVVLGILLYQPILFLILVFTLVPAVGLMYRVLKNRSQELGRELEVNRPISYGMVLDTFSGYVELKLAKRLAQFRQRITENQQYVQALEARSYLYSLLPLRVIEMVSILAIVTIFLYSLLIAGDTSGLVTIVGLFAAAAYRLMPSVNRILTALVLMKQNTTAMNALAHFREPEWAAHNPPPVDLPAFQQQIEFKGVGFNFPGSDRSVLSDISFTVQRGEKIGFIGSSGSGKTTLMNILLRFYQQQQGEVLVDGVPLSLAHTDAWHEQIGYVKQDTFLMNASLRDNITLGDKNPDAARLAYALEQASLSEFVAGLPDGLDSTSGERGARLSGGQRQRIGIARALYKNARVLVMDEATSALDNQTEREVSDAINKLSGTDITIFIIAHRLTTLRQCDRIYELKNGEIASVYTYDELIARHG